MRRVGQRSCPVDLHCRRCVDSWAVGGARGMTGTLGSTPTAAAMRDETGQRATKPPNAAPSRRRPAMKRAGRAGVTLLTALLQDSGKPAWAPVTEEADPGVHRPGS